MRKCIYLFNHCVTDLYGMRAYYLHLRDHCHIPESEIQDLLRAEVVNIVSAMDRFIHEIVRIGFVSAFNDPSNQTSKAKSVTFKLATLNEVRRCASLQAPQTIAENNAEYWINKEIIEILKSLSFQKIDKIKDALSYIWSESHKIQVIIARMQYPGLFTIASVNDKQKFLEQKIDLIASRRNQIVHEADYDTALQMKQHIDTQMVDDIISFIKDFVYSIYENITNDSSYTRV